MNNVNEAKRPLIILSAYKSDLSLTENHARHKHLLDLIGEDIKIQGYTGALIGSYKGQMEQSIMYIPADFVDYPEYKRDLIEYIKGFGQECALMVSGPLDIASLIYPNGTEEVIGYWVEVSNSEALESDSYTLDVCSGKTYKVITSNDNDSETATI